MATSEAPAWARGYPVEELRKVAALYREVDKQYVLGAFGMVKENTVAEWLSEGELFVGEDGYAACQVRVAKVRTPVRDFTGEVCTYIPPGAMVMAHPVSAVRSGWSYLLEGLRGEWEYTRGQQVWLEGWAENPDVRNLADDAHLVPAATKIKASSELVQVWAPVPTPPLTGLAFRDAVTLGKLHVQLAALAQEAAWEVEGLATSAFAQHYSSYNARHAWTALSLRGYVRPGGQPDSSQIVKPAEMSKAWKAENPDWQQWELAFTPAMQYLERTAELVRGLELALGGGQELAQLQRVRLMRLEPGGGELTRHSDITDPEAGTALGKIARIHVPLITNPDVRFRQWTLEGRQVECNMAAGEVWYLDTRKPHRAGNYGTTPRVHLVADVYVTPALQELIASSREAPLVPA